MAVSAKVICLWNRMRDRSHATSRPLLRAFELRHHTLPALGDLLRTCTSELHDRSGAQIAEVLLELKQRHQRLVWSMNELDTIADADFWQHLPFREPFVEFLQMTAAQVALLIREAQVLRT